MWSAMLTYSDQADKTVQSASGGFKFFGGREDKYQEASDLYIAAANAFRMQQSSQFLFLLFLPLHSSIYLELNPSVKRPRSRTNL